MSRTIHEQRLLLLLKSELNEFPLPDEVIRENFGSLTPDDWNGLMKLAETNNLFPLLMDALLRNRAIPIPMPVGRFLEQVTIRNSFAYYQKVSLLSSIQALLRQENVTAYVLKGVSLNILYPKEESRSFGDIDIYFPDEEGYRRIHSIFEASGYRKEQEDMTDYHESYRYTDGGASCTVELHYRLTTAWQTGDFDRRLASIYERAIRTLPARREQVMETEFSALPVTLDALYLLMHMFQHFMNKGFGLRLFTDWVIFWRKKSAEIDASMFAGWIRELGLNAFVDAVNCICVQELGMELPTYGWFCGKADEAVADELLQDVFSGGDFGHLDENRIVVTSRHSGLKAYLFELHRQTKKRYPRASRCVILLPVLWLTAAAIFQYNNLFRRKISLREVLASSSSRNHLAKKLHIFDES